ncbi:SH3 domain-containing protein [Desulfobacca acetoxidans]
MLRINLVKEMVPKLVVWGIALWLASSGIGYAQTYKITQSRQEIFSSPDFASPSVVTAPEGAELMVIQQAGEWYQVEYQGKKGWVHQQAFPSSKKFDLTTILRGRAVQETKTDEVALASKGFTPEVEAGYRQKHPTLNYALVDEVEKFGVTPNRLQAFIKEGGLQP